MRYFLRYLETNKQRNHQEDIIITKKTDICTSKFALEESEKAYRYNQAYQTGNTVERVVIIK